MTPPQEGRARRPRASLLGTGIALLALAIPTGACVVSATGDEEPTSSGGASTGGNGVAGENAGGAALGDAGAAGSPTTGCAPDLSEDGRCEAPMAGADATVLAYCAGNDEVRIDCAQVGTSCNVDGGRANCGDLTRADGCGTLTALGTCEGNSLVYCDATSTVQNGVSVQTPRRIPCDAYGQVCNPTAGFDGGAVCLSYGSCPSGVTANGECDGNKLRFCDAFTNPNGDETTDLFEFDCGVDRCEVIGGFADCYMPAATDGCGALTPDGSCNGEVLEKCSGGVKTTENCEALGLQCLSSGVGFACLPGKCAETCPSGFSCNNAGSCVADSAPTREWTVMVYIVGNNNLASSAWADLQEMEVVGSSSAVQVVSEFELSERYVGGFSSIPSRYYQNVHRGPIVKDSDRGTLTSTMEDLGDVNMSTPGAITEFVRWAAATYPAKHYSFIMWDHGAGYEPAFTDGPSEIELLEIAEGVRDGGVHMDLIGFDACLMGMHEVGATFRGLADVVLHSQEVEPANGYDYDSFLADLADQPTMTAAQLAKSISDSYFVHYDASPGRGRSLTQSSVDTSKSDALSNELGSFSRQLLDYIPANRAALTATLSSTDIRRFRYDNHADLSSVLGHVSSELDGGAKTGADDLATWLTSNTPVIHTAGSGSYTDVSGLSLNVPRLQGYSASYEFENYRAKTAHLPLEPWHAVLGSLISGTDPEPMPGTGAVNAFSVRVDWADSPDGSTSGADLDLYVYEPNGDFAVPVNGTVSPNGILSGDSYDTELPSESYELKASHEPGQYVVLVHAFDVPAGTQVYPRLQMFRPDLPGGSRTLLRAKIEDRKLVEYPMDKSNPVVPPISSSNIEDVQNLVHTDIWWATVIEVE